MFIFVPTTRVGFNINIIAGLLIPDLVIHQIKMTVDRYILRDFTKIGHPVGLG